MSSFGGAYGKTTGDYVNAAKDAIVTMITALPEITIKDEEDEFVSKEFKEMVLEKSKKNALVVSVV